MKNLKPVPADKKKSLGKLPTDVRNKMGYAKKGSMMKARYGTMAKGDVNKALEKEKVKKADKELTRKTLIKRLRGAQVGPAEEAKVNKMTKIEMDKKLASMPKKAKGGEMKKPMKAVLGAMALGAIGALGAKKVLKKKASASSGTTGLLSKESGMKLPMKDLYQKATEQQMAKKSMGGEMKQGYGAARTSGMGLQDEDLIPGKSMDYYKDLM